MTQQTDDDSVFENPQGYGIQDLEAPGEPNREAQPDITPVPGTGYDAKQQHKREHDEEPTQS